MGRRRTVKTQQHIMKEFWDISHRRGVASLPIWGMDDTVELRGLTLAQHTANVNALPVLAQTRVDKEALLTAALAASRVCFAEMAELNVRVPRAIEALLDPEDGLHDQLDEIYAITAGKVEDADLRRARKVARLWKDFNTQQAAQTPPKPAFTPKFSGQPVTVAQFDTLLTTSLTAQDTEEAARKEVSKVKTALRVMDRKVDRDNKRWYAAWIQLYPEGTPEGDAARTNVPTEAGVPEPTPLPIFSLTAHPDHTGFVVYAEGGGLHASTMEVLYMLPGETEFGHTAKVILDGQLIGPFPPNTLVSVRTRVANSTPGVVWGDIVQVLIPA